MLPYAPLRAAVLVAFLLWVIFQFGGSLIRLLEPPQRVRAPDTAAIPSHEVNPRPLMGSLPPAAPLSEAQALETLRQQGYLDLAPLTAQPDGAWVTTASRAGNGGRIGLQIDRDGRVTQR
jgi:hypothetical protein